MLRRGVLLCSFLLLCLRPHAGVCVCVCLHKRSAPCPDYSCAMQNVRVVQRNLVYVVGLALELCHEDLLKTDKYFGQFGKIIKASMPCSTCQL